MGTMDELFEMLTWNNLGIHEKKVFVLNVNGFYNALIQLLDTMDQQGFMYDKWRSRVIVCDSVAAIMDALN
jgi:predicted Rossmann-fold nucleotide-binding protein